MDLLTIGNNGQNEHNLSCGKIPMLSCSSHKVCINIIKGTHIYINHKNHKEIFKEKVSNKAFLHLGYADPVTDTGGVFKLLICILPHLKALSSMQLVIHSVRHIIQNATKDSIQGS